MAARVPLLAQLKREGQSAPQSHEARAFRNGSPAALCDTGLHAAGRASARACTRSCPPPTGWWARDAYGSWHCPPGCRRGVPSSISSAYQGLACPWPDLRPGRWSRGRRARRRPRALVVREGGSQSSTAAWRRGCACRVRFDPRPWACQRSPRPLRREHEIELATAAYQCESAVLLPGVGFPARAPPRPRPIPASPSSSRRDPDANALAARLGAGEVPLTSPAPGPTIDMKAIPISRPPGQRGFPCAPNSRLKSAPEVV